MKKNIYSLLISGAFLFSSIFISNMYSYSPIPHLGKPNLARATYTPVPVSTITLSPTPNLNNISNTDSYEKIASQAIQASNNAMEQMKWIIIAIISTLITLAGAIVSYFIKAQKDFLDYANGVRKELNEASQKLITAEQQINNISSNYIYLLSELSHQSVAFLPPEMAIYAFEQGRITKDEFRVSQIWLAWAKWYYTGKEEGYLQLKEYKETSQSLPNSIRRVMIAEIERIKEAVKKRGMIYKKDDELLKKLLFLLDLEIINRASLY